MPPKRSPETYLTASDVARVLRVRPSAVSNWMTRGSGPLPEPSAYASGAPLWTVSAVRRVLDEQYAEAVAILDTLNGD